MKAKASTLSVQAEIEFRLRNGGRQVSIAQIGAELATLGYRLDRDGDCRSVARYMTGERAGQSYPACALRAVQKDDGKCAFHFEARRDANYKAFTGLRDEIFAVSGECIFEL